MKILLLSVSLALLSDIIVIGQQPNTVARGFAARQLISNVLSTTQVSGSLEYNGKCGSDFFVPDLPAIRVPKKLNGESPQSIFRYMFSIDSRMAISQEGNGNIRVIESGVQTDVLHVRINHLSFNRTSDPDEALHVVLSAPEVRSFMKSNAIGQPFNVHEPPLYLLPGPHASPMPGIRNISGELNDVTLAEALDFILQTFPGLWLYQDCENLNGQRVVYFGLFPDPGKMWFWGDGQTMLR